MCWFEFIMRWIEAVYSPVQVPPSASLTAIPEFLLRPELIPIKEPDKWAVAEAERIVGSRR